MGYIARSATALSLVLLVVACKGVLDVPNPQAFGNSALDNPVILKNVADGAEGLLHFSFDDMIVATELQSDEMESTSTWIDWEDASEGRLRHDWASTGVYSDPQDQLLRARFASQSAKSRIDAVLGATASTSPLNAQVLMVDAMTDLLLGTGWCEAPLSSNAARSPDGDVFKQAITKFTRAIAAAQSITGDAVAQAKWLNVGYAGRARANLMAGNYSAAKADAQQVAAGFEYKAIYAEGTGGTQSATGNQFNQNRNRSGGLRRMYFGRVHVIDSTGTGEAYLRDWSATTLDDRRMAVTRKANQLGVNNRFDYYGITKYADRAAPIRMLSKIESTLIEAEVAMQSTDYATEAVLLNSLRSRTAVGLPGISVPTTAGLAQTALLNERMAELWVEGSRMQDLYRYNLVGSVLGAGRATKLPLSRNEILNNTNMKLGGGSCPGISQ